MSGLCVRSTLLLIYCHFLIACQSPVKVVEPSAEPAQVRMDQTVGTYGTGRENRLILVTMALSEHEKLTETSDANVVAIEKSSGKLLPQRYVELVNSWGDQYGITRVADWPLLPLGMRCLIFENTGPAARETIVVELNKLPLVDTAQSVQHFKVRQNTPYNDPYLHLQHAMESMHAEYTHRWASGEGVTIAVVDTGMDVSHPEIAERSLDSFNFVDKDELQFRSDVHGTAVAGVIAAAANNKTGIVGIAPRARLLPMKACWQTDGGNDNASCNSITLIKALNFAIQEEVDVINLSLAGPEDPLLEQLVQKALERNIIVVGALSPNKDEIFPSGIKGTIGVAQTDDATNNMIKAPGRNVLSLHPQKSYDFFNGSSFSTAHISGLAALIRELRPEWSASNVSALIKVTADRSGAANACRAVGYIVDADLGVCDI